METGINRPQKHQGSGAPLTGAQMGDANPPSGERMNEPVQQAQSASPAEQVGGADPRKNLKPDAQTKIDIHHLNFFYGSKQALTDVSLPIRERQVTALIGPSGCGKSTFLRTLNRMNDLIPNTRTEGEAIFEGENIYSKSTDVVLLMDEPASALDPIATLKIEELITELSANYTIVIVTHNMQQAARVSQYTGFFLSREEYKGRLIEYGPTVEIFEHSKRKETEDYVSGRFG